MWLAHRGVLAAVIATAVHASSWPTLQAGSMRLNLQQANGIAAGLQLADGGHEILSQAEPAQAALLSLAGEEEVVSAGYTAASQLSATLLEANATLSHSGTTLLISDRWAAVGGGSLARFELRRTMAVLSSIQDDGAAAHRGMQSRLLLDLATTPPSATVADLTAFAPSLWYGNNSGIISGGAIGSDKTLTDYFIRADRFAAPLFSVLSPPSEGERRIRGRATLFSLDVGLETVMADNASTILVDDRLGFGSLGLHQRAHPPPDNTQPRLRSLDRRSRSSDSGATAAPIQLGYLFPGTEFERTYTLGNKVLRRYHSVSAGSVTRCALAITVKAIESPSHPASASAKDTVVAPGTGESAGSGDLWGLIKASWPLQRVLYAPAPSNGTAATPTIAAAREAIASTVAKSVFRAPTSSQAGPQIGPSCSPNPTFCRIPLRILSILYVRVSATFD